MMNFSASRKTGAVFFAAFLLLAFATGAFAEKKIVLIAGALDSHPLGTHEYENNVLLLKDCLDRANVRGLKPEVVFNGWPDDPSALDDADTIVLTTSGSDREEKSHPLYVGDHFAQLEKQMKRGCGLVLIHWSTFHPTRVSEKILDWVGGYFDYETGTNGPTQKWFSKIETHDWIAMLARGEHPISHGLKPIPLKEEFYFNLRFRDNDPRVTPILLVGDGMERKENIVGWATERANGGRSFGFTGGHFYTNWWNPDFRKLVLNAIVWTAKAEVPTGGVESTISKKVAALVSRKVAAAKLSSDKKTADKKILPPAPPDPTKLGKEEDWKDGRWNEMDNGQFVASILPTANGNISKAFSIRIGEHEEAAVCYDTILCNVRAGWTGKFLEFDPTRFGFIVSPKIAGDLQFVSTPGGAWNSSPRFLGYFRSGKRVVLSYVLGDIAVLDSPWFESSGDVKIFTRSLEIGSCASAQYLWLAEKPGAQLETNEVDGIQIAVFGKETNRLAAAVVGDANAKLIAQNEKLTLEIPPRAETKSCKVFFWNNAAADLKPFAAAVKQFSAFENLRSLTNSFIKRWGDALEAKGQMALPSGDPYVVDTLTVPYENPWKALMFLSGVDFFENGDAAVCSIHGDVWLVSGIDDQLQNLRWKRFATGLFQPLGLKIVNDNVYVLGRDRITRLHDINNDGEADFYENFFSGIRTEPGHNYVTSLSTDSRNNFYYADEVGLHRVSADGKKFETVATGFRNPNGMSVSPDGVITVAPQEGNWTPSSAICEVKRGGHYGYGGPQISPERPLGYDAPLCWMPRMLDNSTGSQFWVTSDRWGPFKNQLFNLSYGRCTMMMVMRDVVNGQAQGAVYPWKLHFLSGVMRAAFRKQDGQLYLVGSLGWSTSASKDGCFQRVRYTGKKVYSPEKFHVCANGIELGFTEPLDRETAEDVGSYAIEQWNYHYAKEYGSKEYSLVSPETIGRDQVDVASAKLLPDGRSVFLKIPNLQPVNQMHIKFNVDTADGKPMRGEIFNTINKLAPAKE